MVAFIFPGQGSQYVGMGEDLYSGSAAAREVYHEASSVLGLDIATVSFKGPEEELQRTANCQPAVLTASVACLRVLEEDAGGVLEADLVAGHSLGEYAALVASGALTFRNALVLVRERGRLMEEASRTVPGGMVAVLGLDGPIVEEICASSGGAVYVANYNSPGQVVISGEKKGLAEASAKLQARGAKRLVPLAVSGPFHTVLMRSAGASLSRVIEGTEFGAPRVAVLSNVTGREMKSAEEIKRALVEQVSHPVRWQEEMEFALRGGEKTFVEVGPGKVLSGLMRRIAPEVEVLPASDSETIRATAERLHSLARDSASTGGRGRIHATRG